MSDEDGNTAEEVQEELSEVGRRRGAQKLSALVRAADDDALRRFRRQHLRNEGTIDHEDLVAARTVLEHLVRAFDDGGEPDWSRVSAWAEELGAEDASSKAKTLDDGDDADDAPNTATVPRPPDLHERLPPSEALPAPHDKPSPWASWSQSGARASTASAPPPPMPSAPPPAMPSAPPPAMPSAPPPAPGPDDTRSPPTPGSELRSGAPMRPQRTIPEGLPDTLADVTAPPLGSLERALPFVAPDEGQTQHLVHHSMAHGLALTLREYAALCAEADESPQRRHLVHERYQVSDTTTRELVRKAYELRFEHDPALRSQWQRQYDEFRAALRGSR